MPSMKMRKEHTRPPTMIMTDVCDVCSGGTPVEPGIGVASRDVRARYVELNDPAVQVLVVAFSIEEDRSAIMCRVFVVSVVELIFDCIDCSDVCDVVCIVDS